MSTLDPQPAPPIEPRILRWGFLGRVAYTEAFALQNRLRDAVKSGEGGEHLLLLEHPHVFTLGRNASVGDVVATTAWLQERQVDVVETDRGGQVTYHGPGQLIGYPVVNLSPDRRDIRRYVRDVLDVLIGTLRELGVEAERGASQEEIGLWVGGAKIASIGVHLSRWVTTHGFALNLSTDLGLFGGIVACGLQGVRMTSVEQLTGTAPPLADVAAIYARRFADHFGRSLEPIEKDQLGLSAAS